MRNIIYFNNKLYKTRWLKIYFQLLTLSLKRTEKTIQNIYLLRTTWFGTKRFRWRLIISNELYHSSLVKCRQLLFLHRYSCVIRIITIIVFSFIVIIILIYLFIYLFNHLNKYFNIDWIFFIYIIQNITIFINLIFNLFFIN